MNRYLFAMTLWATLPSVASAQEEAGGPLTLEALTEKVDALERLDLSGYVQGRYVVEQRSTRDDPRDTFLLRRGRLKASYDADWSKYVLQIDASGREALDDVATVLRQNPSLRVELGGHTDSQGSETHNEGLSQRRAEAARSYLVAQGIAASRLEAKGFGESSPAADNATADGRRANRRTEVEVIGR